MKMDVTRRDLFRFAAGAAAGVPACSDRRRFPVTTSGPGVTDSGRGSAEECL